jgi:hypothetical protein
MKGHTGGAMTMGTGFPLDKSTKHKLNTHSSMESEIVAVDDLIPQILWVCLFLKAQRFAVSNNILYHDNKKCDATGDEWTSFKQQAYKAH